MSNTGLARIVCPRALLVVSGLCPIVSMAQSAVLSVPVSSVSSGERGTCSLKMDKVAKPPGDGKLRVEFTDTAGKSTKLPAATVVQLDGRDVRTYAAGTPGDSIPLGDALLNATVSVMRSDARTSLCDVVTWPLRPQLLPNTLEYTAFAADGEIGKALRGGSSSNLTGSLGMEHRRIHPKRAQSILSQGEEARAFITVAGSADTLNSSTQSAFGAAVLDPKLAGSGFLDGASIEYYLFGRVNTVGGTWGPRITAAISRSLWSIVDTTSAPGETLATETVTRALPLTAFDLGLRFVFINHLADAKGNNYALGFDPRVVWRGVSPNTDKDALVIKKALGQDVRWHHGLAISMWLRVRTVTASADIYNISKGDGQSVDGLTGLQSVVKFAYSSWLFVF